MADKKKPNGAVDQPAISAMSDKKKTNGDKANSDLATITGASKGAKFADKLNKIFGLCSELKSDTTGAVDFEKTLEENTALKAALKRRDDELNKLRTELGQLKQAMDTNLDAFGKKYADYNLQLQSLSATNKELRETKEKLAKKSDEANTLEAENRRLKKGASEIEVARKKAEATLVATEKDRRMLENELADVQRTISFYGEENLVNIDPLALELKLEQFADQCHAFVMGCFQTCEAPPNINQLEAHLSGRGSHVPLSQSTSPASRLMRAAGAEAVIISTIVDHIFTDIYYPGHVSRQKDVSFTLDLLTDTRREALVRCQLFAEFQPNEEIISSVTQAAFNEICVVLDTLLPAGQLRDKFHEDVVYLLQSALALWMPLQVSEQRVIVDFSMTTPDLARQNDFYGDFDRSIAANATIQPSSPGATHTSPVLMLFPLILMGDEVLARPKALWSDQAALIEAREEAAAASERGGRTSGYGTASFSDGPRHLNHSRRLSISGRFGVGARSSVAAASSSPAPPAKASDFTATKLGSPGLGRRVENGVKTGAGK